MGMASALQTLCGQAYGAKKYHMLGIYLQRSWAVLFICCVLLLPIFIFATPILMFLGQPQQVAELAGEVTIWLIPFHFCLGFHYPLFRFMQSQLKNAVTAWVSLIVWVIHVMVCWLVVFKFQVGLVGTAATLNISWCGLVIGLLGYTVWGGCPLTWSGFSLEAFSGLWEFTKLSISSGIMLWYLFIYCFSLCFCPIFLF